MVDTTGTIGITINSIPKLDGWFTNFNCWAITLHGMNAKGNLWCANLACFRLQRVAYPMRMQRNQSLSLAETCDASPWFVQAEKAILCDFPHSVRSNYFTDFVICIHLSCVQHCHLTTSCWSFVVYNVKMHCKYNVYMILRYIKMHCLYIVYIALIIMSMSTLWRSYYHIFKTMFDL